MPRTTDPASGDLAIILPADEGFEAARTALAVPAVVPDIVPAAIATPADTSEVADAVRFARDSGLSVTVRSGGHSVSFSSLREGALTIDLSALTGVEVDTGSMLARIQPGVTSRALAVALDGTGAAFPLGHKSTVAVGGFFLAGGNGWNQARWGSAIESIHSATIVLADGEVIEVDQSSDPEVFAAVRGAGPGFPGIVTEFTVRLHPEPAIRRLSVVYPTTLAADAAAWADSVHAAIGPDIELTLFMVPGGSSMSGQPVPAIVVSMTAFASTDAAAAGLLDEILALPRPDGALNVSTGADTIVGMLDGDTLPEGLGQASQQAWTAVGFADVVPALVEVLGTTPSRDSQILISSSSFRRAEAPIETAAYLPLGLLTVAPYSYWEPGVDDAANQAWPTSVIRTIEPLWTGHYVGEVDFLRTPALLEGCFRPQSRALIEAVRERIDPGGLFAGFPGQGD